MDFEQTISATEKEIGAPPVLDSEDLFDQALEEGAKNGVFDELAKQALEDYRAGRTEEI